MLLMPFLASIPAAPLQVEEIRTLFAEQRIFKSSVAQYAKGKLIAAFLSGAIVAGGAFAAQAVLWNIIAKPCDVNIYDYLVIVLRTAVFITRGNISCVDSRFISG